MQLQLAGQAATARTCPPPTTSQWRQQATARSPDLCQLLRMVPFTFLTGISALLLTTASGDVESIASTTPLCAIVGEDATLLCRYSPETSDEDVDVAWMKNGGNSTVYMYIKRMERSESQDPEYRGRTNMNIANGSVALTIFNVTHADAGTYNCYIRLALAEFSDSLELRVAEISACDLEMDLGIVSNEKERVKNEIEYIQAACIDVSKYVQPTKREWSRARCYTGRLTLDPDTAHPRLALSGDPSTIQWRYTAQKRPDSPERFDTDYCVLARERFSRGIHYWEVEVGMGRWWQLGVSYEAVSRKGWITATPERGYWGIDIFNGQYRALTAPRTILSLPVPPTVVGVMLDYESGRVAFYNVEDKALLYGFNYHPFFQKLRPYFCTVDADHPLIIRP